MFLEIAVDMIDADDIKYIVICFFYKYEAVYNSMSNICIVRIIFCFDER